MKNLLKTFTDLFHDEVNASGKDSDISKTAIDSISKNTDTAIKSTTEIYNNSELSFEQKEIAVRNIKELKKDSDSNIMEIKEDILRSQKERRNFITPFISVIAPIIATASWNYFIKNNNKEVQLSDSYIETNENDDI